jgi:phenylacetate-coenzyme A ligase PaaK-like adenylate-forming protein
LFPLHERLKGHSSVALRRDLERAQWLGPQALADLQLRRLTAFLRNAVQDVPYYGAQFAALGLRVDDIRSLDDLRHLPFLTKPLIREHTEQLKSKRARRLVRYNTGGSTGEPLVFYMGIERISHDVAAKWRATRWWDVDIGDPEVVLWGSPVELGKQDRIKEWRDRLLRSHLLPAFAMSEENMRRYLARIAATRPRMLFGYASALALLARFAEAERREMSRLGIKVAFTTGETLYPDQRAVIERVFGAPVANGYGSRDAGFIAHQCPHGALHISEHIIVELLGADGEPVTEGQSGEVVTTHLATGDFPFIRYRTGDMAVAGRPCPCGRGLPALAEVQGRTTDFIHTPSGVAMHALALIYEVRDKPGVKAFKFVQAADLSLELFLVAGPELTAEIEQSIRTGVLRRVGPDASLAIRRVDAIPPEKSGKYRYVVSRARG